jgi:aspartate/methionine/tyrosine aminotransferase
MLSALGCRVVELPCGPETRFQPTVAQLDALDEPPAGLIVASPANPTGTMVPPEELRALVDWCSAHGTRLISDEIYHGISYGVPTTCAWSIGRDSIVVNSFSKYFSMTGWRIGWLLVPDELLDAVDRLAGNFTICPPALSQLAAVAAFGAYDELDANVARYAENRAMLLDALPSIGLDKLAPADGAFYVYADVSEWLLDRDYDSAGLAARLLDEAGVAVAPGIDFDTVDGGRFIRLCFAGDGSDIARAVSAMGEWRAAHSS